MKKKELEKQVKILTGIVIALGIHEIVKHQKRKAKKHLMKKMLMRQFMEHSKDRHSCHCHEHDHHCHDHHNKKWMLPLILALGSALCKEFSKKKCSMWGKKHHHEHFEEKAEKIKQLLKTIGIDGLFSKNDDCECHHKPHKHH